MQNKLLAEFPEVSYDVWRAQADKDLKGADFDKRLLTRTLEGIVVRPLYTARDLADEPDAGGFAGLPPYRRGSSAFGRHGLQWDVRAEQRATDPVRARRELADDLAGGATSLWLRFDASVRTADAATALPPDGLTCSGVADLAALLGVIEWSRVRVALDAGANIAAAAAFLAFAAQSGGPESVRGSLGCDPLGALARDGALPCDLERAAAWLGELTLFCTQRWPQLRAAHVSTETYHAAGANCVQELAYALATGVTYLRWSLAAGASVEQAAAQLGFGVSVASDLFMEIAKLRALRLCWAKVIAAHGGGPDAQNTTLHAFTSPRTKTQRDPWVNMLRTTTEAFAAMVGGADALTTRGFDEALGVSDGFARRIGRNAQIILNEEAHVMRVADAAGGSYYVETLTDELARAAWTAFQDVERAGGMPSALRSGSIARDIAATATARATAIAKRQTPITGVSEYAHLNEDAVQRPAAEARPDLASPAPAREVQAALQQLTAAGPTQRMAAAVHAAASGARIDELARALVGTAAPERVERLPVRRHAEPFEALRARADRHTQRTQAPPRAWLCNLGAIPDHKARAGFAAGFLQAGGVAAIENDGFASVETALEAFAQARTQTVVVCGSDAQYPDWVPKLAPALRARGATQIVLAGRPGDQQAAYEAAGVTGFIFVGGDVVTTLGQLLDGMGVAP